MFYLNLMYAVSQIPTFDQVRQPPKNFNEGLWIVGMMCFCFTLWVIQNLVNIRLKTIKEQFEARLKEDAIELAQRDNLIKYLMSQNRSMMAEKSQMISAVIRLTRMAYGRKINKDELNDVLSNATEQPKG